MARSWTGNASRSSRFFLAVPPTPHPPSLNFFCHIPRSHWRFVASRTTEKSVAAAAAPAPRHAVLALAAEAAVEATAPASAMTAAATETASGTATGTVTETATATATGTRTLTATAPAMKIATAMPLPLRTRTAPLRPETPSPIRTSIFCVLAPSVPLSLAVQVCI